MANDDKTILDAGTVNERLKELREKQKTVGITPEEMEEKAALIQKYGAVYEPHARTEIMDGAETKAVKLLTSLGILSAENDLDGFLTKGEAAKLLFTILTGRQDASEYGVSLSAEQQIKEQAYIMLGQNALDDAERAVLFTDVPEELLGYINYGVSKGYLFGIGGDRFEPEADCTVEQFICMLDCLLGYTVKGTPYKSSDYVTRAYDGGLLRFVSALHPREFSITKRIAAILLYNALEARWCYDPTEQNPYAEFFKFSYEAPHLYPGIIMYEVFSKDMKGNLITMEERLLDHEPYHVFYKDDGRKKPVVVWVHGTYSTCYDRFNKYVCYRLAEEGYYVVEPELYGHGKRTEDDPIYNADETLELKKDLDMILDYVDANDSQADIRRFGIGGHSLGAVNAFHYTVKGKYHPLASVLVAGPADLERHISPEPGVGTTVRQWMEGDKAYNFTFKTGETLISVTRDYALEHNYMASTLPYAENMTDVAVLTLRGELDIATDFDDDEAKLKTFFDAHEHTFYETHVQQGLEHAVSIEETDEMCAFFKEWL